MESIEGTIPAQQAQPLNKKNLTGFIALSSHEQKRFGSVLWSLVHRLCCEASQPPFSRSPVFHSSMSDLKLSFQFLSLVITLPSDTSLLTTEARRSVNQDALCQLCQRGTKSLHRTLARLLFKRSSCQGYSWYYPDSPAGQGSIRHVLPLKGHALLLEEQV